MRLQRLSSTISASFEVDLGDCIRWETARQHGLSGCKVCGLCSELLQDMAPVSGSGRLDGDEDRDGQDEDAERAGAVNAPAAMDQDLP